MTTYVYPGCGYGGYCLPKDTNALYAATKAAGFDAQILKNVISTNDHMPEFMARRIEKAAGTDKSCPIGILGLSFKPGSDDVRDAPSAKIIRRLMDDGYTHILAYDPVAKEEFAKYYPLKLSYTETYQELLDSAELLVITTAWEEFKDLKSHTHKPAVDCRYML